jgi:hypothetical protein
MAVFNDIDLLNLAAVVAASAHITQLDAFNGEKTGNMVSAADDTRETSRCSLARR